MIKRTVKALLFVLIFILLALAIWKAQSIKFKGGVEYALPEANKEVDRIYDIEEKILIDEDQREMDSLKINGIFKIGPK